VYIADSEGNRIPDYSYCGFRKSQSAIPSVANRVRVEPQQGDATTMIQSAIDFVGQLMPDSEGLRGAVLLAPGVFDIEGQLILNRSGVILRGTVVDGKPMTQLRAIGHDRRALIRLQGEGQPELGPECVVRDSSVPIGARKLAIAPDSSIRPGVTIRITHPSTREWIHSVDMDQFPTDERGSWLDWRPGSVDVTWERQVQTVQMTPEGMEVELDIPLTMPLRTNLSPSRMQTMRWPERLHTAGVEALVLVSHSDSLNPKDEEHAWDGIRIEKAIDVWCRDLSARGFVGSAISIDGSARQVSVIRCNARQPRSELAEFRRRTFYTCGQQTLFLNCQSESGIHDFAVGYLAAGPNAFVHCEATHGLDFSGPIESWSSGVLLDNVTMDGGGLALTNRETEGQGVGWTTCSSMLWQCTAPVITCRNPPGYQNWAYGCWGGFVGNGRWSAMNEFVDPKSLFEQQLKERVGDEIASLIVSSPAHGKNDSTALPQWRLRDKQTSAPESNLLQQADSRRLAIKDGWLTIGGQMVSGDRVGTMWWRGSMLPSRTPEFGVGVTRFAPGRTGEGFTDDLDALTDSMRDKQQIVLEHHWGLWYDRRRDDHEMIRRIDGRVWAPFYEQPWARSGQGTAWDGLSKYDLESFNPWYFRRLNEFAGHCDAKGLILLQQMYFQHNILEAGAHWADFPWRSANCLQSVGFAEPPPYVNKKRIFQADEFYDVEHPVRKALHEKYIRKCLDNMLGRSNVLFSIGEEYTGPAHFVRFWLDTIRAWKQEHPHANPIVCLGCTKDVQDSILNDPEYESLIDVIDLKYWWYVSDGALYAPEGGKNLAPRQQLREWKGTKSRSDLQTARQIAEYRHQFPNKAILSPYRTRSPWSVVAAGGSIPIKALPADDPAWERVAAMHPFPLSDPNCYGIADVGKEYLVYSEAERPWQLDLSKYEREFRGKVLDLATGNWLQEFQVNRGQNWTHQAIDGKPMLVWIHSRETP
jgi:hypothetical protein